MKPLVNRYAGGERWAIRFVPEPIYKDHLNWLENITTVHLPSVGGGTASRSGIAGIVVR